MRKIVLYYGKILVGHGIIIDRDALDIPTERVPVSTVNHTLIGYAKNFQYESEENAISCEISLVEPYEDSIIVDLHPTVYIDGVHIEKHRDGIPHLQHGVLREIAMFSEPIIWRSPMTVEDFLFARLDEYESNLDLGSPYYDAFKALIKANRDLVEEHKKWPVMLQEQSEFTRTYNPDNPDELRYALLQKLEWATRDAYFQRFGKEAPTNAFVKTMLKPHTDHPDFNPEWVS